MKKTIKYLIIILLIIAVFLIFIINKKEESTYSTEFKNYKEEYIAPKTKYECNEFSITNISTDELMQIYFNNYKNAALEEPENAYNLLDKEYREKRFGNVEKFKEYITSNYDLIRGKELYNYTMSKNDSYNQYICRDNNGKYYVFKETAIMEYTMLLDTYIIDLPEFTEKYNSATEEEKVALNIEKFIQAINDKSYYYAYNCLADSYKNNYFKTQEEFEVYVMQNFYENSSIEYKNFDLKNDIYTYSVLLTDKVTGEQMNKTFVMQLGEGTEFVLSFDK